MPTWTHKLNLSDVFHNEDLTFEQRRDEIVRRIKASRFYDEDDMTLFCIVDDLATAQDTENFDEVWDAFYDYADDVRVWVATA